MTNKNSKDTKEKRVGYYCWAGPDMIRMTNLKYFNPKIDEQSLLSSYDLGYLEQVKDKLGVTDVWATYSWGFSEESEKEQYEFLASKLKNFKKLGLKVHAYIQGTNIVYNDYKDKNWYCKDEYNRLVPYYRGRKVVCLNNLEFVDYICNKIKKTYDYGFDGIFVDNVHMGQIPIPDLDNKGLFTFAGCNCEVCQNKFEKLYNKKIPTKFTQENYKDYQDFRVNSLTDFVKKLNDTVKNGNMEFGTNSFDPKYDTKKMFGTDLKKLEEHQDYLLFENHSLPGETKNNNYINNLIKEKQIKKPVFVVAYDKGIGYEPQYSQKQINNILIENYNSLFNACVKGSEYITNNIWHNFYIDRITKPDYKKPYDFKLKDKKVELTDILIKLPFIKPLLKKYYNPIYTIIMENIVARKLLAFVMKAL